MSKKTVSTRFAELFPKSNLIGLLERYGGDADDIFEAMQDRCDAREQEAIAGLLGIRPADLDSFARAAYWELIDEIRVRYLSSLTRDEAAKIAEASDGCIEHPDNDDIDWSTDEFIDDWNALHRGEEALAR